MIKIAILKSTNYVEGCNASIVKIIYYTDNINELQAKFRKAVENEAEHIKSVKNEMGIEFDINIDDLFLTENNLTWEFEDSFDDGDYPLITNLYIQYLDIDE